MVSWWDLSDSYGYDFFGRLKTATAPDLNLSYQYNEVGKKTHVANLATGSDESYEYDSLGRVEKVTHENDEGEIIFESDYVIGSDGNRIGVIERRNNSYVTWEYEYDELGRLTSEKRATKFVDLNDNMHILDGDRTRHVTYTYDVDSNRKSETDELASSTKDYYYESNSQRLDYINKNGQLYEDYSWLPGGQQKTKTNAQGHVEDYTWSGENLISIKFTGGTNDRLSIHYNYDENNTLVEREVIKDEGNSYSEETLDHVKYLVDTRNLTGYSQVVAELNVLDDGKLKQIRTNTFTNEIKSQHKANANSPNYLHTDALGSIRSLTSSETSEQYNYTAFGSKLQGSSSLTNYAFTGQVADVSSGLQYHRARWLQVDHASWLSEDSVFEFEYSFGSIYGYLGGNPVSYPDISGNGPSSIEITIVAVILSILVGMVAGVGTNFLADLSFYSAVAHQKNQLPANFYYEESMTAGQVSDIAINLELAIVVSGFIEIIAGAISKAALEAGEAGSRSMSRAMSEDAVNRVAVGQVTRKFGKIKFATQLAGKTKVTNAIGKNVQIQLKNVEGHTFVSRKWDYKNVDDVMPTAPDYKPIFVRTVKEDADAVGRMNPTKMQVSYHATQSNTTLFEMGAQFKSAEAGKIRKFNIYKNEVRFKGLVDLTDDSTVNKLGFNYRDMLQVGDKSYAVTRRWANLLKQNPEIKGVILPSARQTMGAPNIVIWDKAGQYAKQISEQTVDMKALIVN